MIISLNFIPQAVGRHQSFLSGRKAQSDLHFSGILLALCGGQLHLCGGSSCDHLIKKSGGKDAGMKMDWGYI